MQHEAEIKKTRKEEYKRPTKADPEVLESFYSFSFEVFVPYTNGTRDKSIRYLTVNGKKFHKFREPVRCDSEEGLIFKFNNVPEEYFGADGPQTASVETY